MIRTLLFSLALATPAAAQIVVVPLDPVDPGEVMPADQLPGQDAPQLPVFDPEALPGFDIQTLEPSAPGSVVGQDVTTVEEDEVTQGTGAVLRGLDKLAGTAETLDLKTGETVGLGWLQVTLGECRYPVDNPAGDAYAWLTIREEAGEAPIFDGWMISSSPALSALDHARFDVWVIRCTTD